MNPIQKLWIKRIKYLVAIYYKFIAFQFDAVILMYTLFFAGAAIYHNLSRIYIYRDIITSGNWVVILQLIILWAMASGSYKGFLKIPDEVFLTPLNKHGRAFTNYSFRLSEGIYTIIWSISCLVLYFFMSSVPEWRLGFYSLWLLGLLIKLIYINLSFVIYQIQNRDYRKIVKLLFYLLVYAGGFSYLKLWLLGAMSKYLMMTNYSILAIILIIAIYLRGQAEISWNRWITDESNSRANNFAILLKTSPIERGSVRTTASRLSNMLTTWDRFLPFDEKRALLLIYYRMLTRGKGNLALLLQLLAVLLGTILIWGERLVVAFGILAISLLLTDFLMSLWYNLKDNTWIKLYPISKTKQHWAFQWASIVVLLPAFLLLVLVNIAINGAIINPAADMIFISVWLLVVTQIKAYFVYTKMFFSV